MMKQHKCDIGLLELIALYDGHVNLAPGTMSDLAAAGREDGQARQCIERPHQISVNAFLIRDGDRNVLVETGTGSLMGPELGHVLPGLEACGINAESICTVLLTHAHPDHSGGLIRPDGLPSFPNAEIVLHEDELKHWMLDESGANGDARQLRYIRTAQAMLAPYRDRIRTFRGGSVAPGIEALHLPGHTPGHSGFAVNSGRDSLLIWGDIVHVPDAQTRFPDLSVPFDTNPVQAAETRRKTLEMAAHEQLLIAGMHIGFPGLCRIGRSGEGFAIEAHQPA